MKVGVDIMSFKDLENMDFNEFFKKEHSFLNGCEGIGASGIITFNQMINVINIDGEDIDTGKMGWGLGSHQYTREELVKLIYGVEFSEIEFYGEGDFRRGLLYKSIIIRYVNCVDEQFCFIDIPPVLNNSMVRCLEELDFKIKKSCEVNFCDISVSILNTKIDPFSFQYTKDSNIEKGWNSITDALKYYKDNGLVNNFDLFMLPDENELVTIFKDGKVVWTIKSDEIHLSGNNHKK